MTDKDESEPNYATERLAKKYYEEGAYRECVRELTDYLYYKFSSFAETAPPNIDGDFLRDSLDEVYEYIISINAILDGSRRQISVTEKSKLSVKFLALLMSINKSTSNAGCAVKYQEEKEQKQKSCSKARAMRVKKEPKSKRIGEVIERHARDHLKNNATKETPRSIAHAIEKHVAADLAEDRIRPIKAGTIAGRIRKRGVISYKT
jgi:hypothetical protein